MKGNKELLTVLNSLLADELTVINQYMVQSEMCANWGYSKLHKAIRKQAMDEMYHAEFQKRITTFTHFTLKIELLYLIFLNPANQ